MMLLTAKLIGHKLIEITSQERDKNGSQLNKSKLVFFLYFSATTHLPLIYDDRNWKRLPIK